MFIKPSAYKKIVVLLIAFCCNNRQLHAAKYYWISSSASNWNAAANWSSSSGGGGGAAVPGSSDTCYFDGVGGSTGNCSIDANVNVKRFEVLSGYTGTIAQNGFTITVGTGGMKLAGGVFTGSASSITLSATFENSGCAFTSTSGTFEIKEGHFTLSGTGAFLHNNGLVKFFHGTGSSNDTCKITLSTSSSDKYFYDVEMNSSITWNRYYKFPSGGMRVHHTLTTSGTGNKYIGAGTIELLGDYTNSGGVVGGGSLPVGTLKFMGTGDQYLTGSGVNTATKVVDIDIDKASGTLYLVGTISTIHNLKRTNGNVNAGTSRFYFLALGSGVKVTGNFTRSNSLYKLYFIGSSSSSLTIDDTLQVSDSLVFSRTTAIAKGTNAGILCAKGHINIAGNFPVTGTMTLLVNGSGRQVYKSGVIYDFNRLQGSPNIKIEKDIADTLKMEGFHPIQTSFNHVSGVLNTNGARIKFSATNQPTITGSATSSTDLKNTEFCYSSTTSGQAITIASGTQIFVGDTLLMTGAGGVSNSLNTGTVNLKGSMYISCTSTGNAGTATIKINGTTKQHIYGFSGSGTQGRLPNVEIDKSDTLFLHNTICTGSSGTAINFTHTNGVISRGTSTLIFANNCNITSSVSGNRLDLNNVQFTTGTITIASSTILGVNGTLSIPASSSALTINGGTMECYGDLTNSNTNTSIGSVGTTTLAFKGGNDQQFTGPGSSGMGFFPKIRIDKSGGILTLANTISVGQDWTYVAGNVNAGTNSTVYFGGTHNVDAQGTSATMSFYNATFAGSTTQTGDLKVSNNLLINSSSTLAQGSYALGFGGYANNGTHSGTGAVSMIGTGYHAFTKSGGGSTSFGTVTVSRSGGSLKLLSPVNVTGSLSFTKGIIKTTATNLLKLADDATCSGGSDSGYVMGPVIKTGDDVFTFPFGDTAIVGHPYRPLGMTAPASATDAYTAEFKNIEQTNGNAVDDTLETVSYEDYYTMVRSAGSSTVYPNLSFKDGGYAFSDDSTVVAYYNSTNSRWENLGGTARTAVGGVGHLIPIFPPPIGGALIPIIVGKKFAPKKYMIPVQKPDGHHYFVEKSRLLVRYTEDYVDSDGQLSYKIYKLSDRQVILNSSAYPLAVKIGDNRYTFNLATLSGFVAGTNYLLEITNEKAEKYYLRFKY